VIASLEETGAVDRAPDRPRRRAEGFLRLRRGVAAALPLKIICDMMGIPESDNRRMFELSNIILGIGDPEYGVTMDVLMGAAIELSQYAQALGEARLASPGEDITSVLMSADVDGERLTSAEFASFFILLVVAGNETTRNAISHGMKALTDNPDERRKWQSDFEGVAPTAVEEIVRWATPVIHFRRTATRDVELGGQTIREGDKLVTWFSSANRDERAFRTRTASTSLRTPNDHVGYGGGGAHFCLGANLARREIKVMFDELLPDAAGHPHRRRAGHALLGVHPRHQADARRVDAAALTDGRLSDRTLLRVRGGERSAGTSGASGVGSIVGRDASHSS
jgi:cytochrome P450